MYLLKIFSKFKTIMLTCAVTFFFQFWEVVNNCITIPSLFVYLRIRKDRFKDVNSFEI